MKPNIWILYVVNSFFFNSCGITQPYSPIATSDKQTSPIPSVALLSPTAESQSVSIQNITALDQGPNNFPPLGKTTNVILRDVISERLLRIDSRGVIYQIDGLQPNIYFDGGIKINPDETMFLYITFNSKLETGEAVYDLWVSSIDGSQQSLLINDLVGGFQYDWMNQEYVILWRRSRGGYFCPDEITVMNIGTKELSSIPALQFDRPILCYPHPAFNNDASRAVIQANENWLLVDYAQNRVRYFDLHYSLNSLAPWILYNFEVDQLSIVVPDTNRIYYGQDLIVPDQEVELQFLALPNGVSILDNNLLMWDIDRMSVVFDVTKDNHNRNGLANLSLLNGELSKYSVDRASYKQNLGYPSSLVYLSLDGKFLSWTVYKPPENTEPFGAIILDLHTGLITYFDDLEVVGFGEVSKEK